MRLADMVVIVRDGLGAPPKCGRIRAYGERPQDCLACEARALLRDEEAT